MVVNVHDENIKLANLVLAVKNGEEVFIVTDDQETFQLIRVDAPIKHRKAGSAKGLIEISDDFDAPLEDFKDYMP